MSDDIFYREGCLLIGHPIEGSQHVGLQRFRDHFYASPKQQFSALGNNENDSSEDDSMSPGWPFASPTGISSLYRLSFPEQNEQDHVRFDSTRRKKDVSVWNYPVLMCPYFGNGIGNHNLPDRVLISIEMPAGSNLESIKKIIINNDGVEGPSLTIVYSHPNELKNAETILVAEVRSIVALLSQGIPRLIGLKNALAARITRDADVASLTGRVIINLPFNASRSLADVHVEASPNNASIFLITLKKLEEMMTTDIGTVV